MTTRSGQLVIKTAVFPALRSSSQLIDLFNGSILFLYEQIRELKIKIFELCNFFRSTLALRNMLAFRERHGPSAERRNMSHRKSVSNGVVSECAKL